MTIEIDPIFCNVTARQPLPLARDFSERHLVLNAYFRIKSARFLLWIQLIAATHSANFSAGE